MSLDSFYVEPSDYSRVRKISSGTYGQVYEVVNKNSNKHYACKQLNAPNSYTEEKNFLRELEILASFDNMLIIGFHGFNFHSPGQDSHSFQPIIYLDLASNGSVYDHLIKAYEKTPDKDWTPTKRMISLFGIAYGMKILHENNVIHRDLKPGNILLDDNFYPKITDFGFSKISEDNTSQSTTGIGTPIYMAPELIDGYDFTNSVDVYAYAFMAYEIITLTRCFPRNTRWGQVLAAAKENKRPKFPDDPNLDKLKELVTQCWSMNPSERLSFDEIVNALSNKEYFLPEIDEDEYLQYIDMVKQDVVCMKDPLTGAPNITPQHSEPLSLAQPRVKLAISDSIHESFTKEIRQPQFNPSIVRQRSGTNYGGFSTNSSTGTRPITISTTPKSSIDYTCLITKALGRKSSNVTFNIFLYGSKSLITETKNVLSLGHTLDPQEDPLPNFEIFRIRGSSIVLSYPKSVGRLSTKEISTFAKKNLIDLAILCFQADDDSVLSDYHMNVFDIFKKNHRIAIILFDPINEKFKSDLNSAIKSTNPITLFQMRTLNSRVPKFSPVIYEYTRDLFTDIKNLQDLFTFLP